MVRQTGESLKTALKEHIGLTAVAKGIIVSYIIIIPFFIIFALILSYVDFPEKLVSPAVMITTVLSILIAGSTATRNLKSKGWLNGGLVGIIYITVLYLLSSFVLDDFTASRNVLVMAVVSMIAGALGGIVGINMKNNTRSRQKR